MNGIAWPLTGWVSKLLEGDEREHALWDLNWILISLAWYLVTIAWRSDPGAAGRTLLLLTTS
jgi:hypothetical protein